MQLEQDEIIEYTESDLGFDNDKYIKLQKEAIEDRVERFSSDKFYLEVGGKLFYDPHAARVLPGFEPDVKLAILKKLITNAEIVFCINAEDLKENRQLTSENEDYQKETLELLEKLEAKLGKAPLVSLNFYTNDEKVKNLNDKLKKRGYKVYKRYRIKNYQTDLDFVFSPEGFGKDDYIKTREKVVIVTGAASGSGKMSTCIGQIYKESKEGINSGYAKYETFPIWNLDLNHPVNLAYEAATVDIGDFIKLDEFHQKAYGEQAVNYNRDLETYKLLRYVAQNLTKEKHHLRNYKSPTDMGINKAGFAITNDRNVSLASFAEIDRRKRWYQEMVDRDQGEEEWVENCEKLKKKALEFLKEKNYL